MNDDKKPLNHGLEEYLSVARQEQSHLQPEQLSQLLEKAAQVKSSSTSKIILAVSTLIILLTASLYIYNAQTPPTINPIKPEIANGAKNTNANASQLIDKQSEIGAKGLVSNPDKGNLSNNANPEKSPKYNTQSTASLLPLLAPEAEPEPLKKEQVSPNTVIQNYSLINEHTHIVRLSEDELKALGIIVKDQKVYFINVQGSFSDGHSEFRYDPETKAPIKDFVSSDTFPYPALITDELGISTVEYQEDANFDRFLVDDLMKLVPVLVEFGGTPSTDDIKRKRLYPGIICWYLPTSDFFKKLPLHIANEFHCTRDILTNDKCATDTMPSCSNSFEACNNTLASSCDMHLYPNPVQDAFTLEVKVGAEKNVRISLYNLSGKEVKVLSDNTGLSKGLNTLHFDTGGLSNGIYLVEIIADNGEAAYQRLIKQ